MKKYTLFTAGIGSLIALAFAMTASAEVSVSAKAGIRDGVPHQAIMASSTVRARVEARFGTTTPSAIAHRIASSTRSDMASTTRQERQDKIISNEQNRSNNEITARINSLSNLLARISGMKNITDSQKAAFSADIQTEIASLTSLKSSIDSNTSTTSLKTDYQSITKSYRIYALVEPQMNITAAADRALTLAADLNTVATKLQAYVTTASSTGTNVSAAVSALADLSAKTADAVMQANAAITEVAGLKPDQGATTTMQANLAALKDARSKIAAAIKDLADARKDAGQVSAVVRSGFKTDIGEGRNTHASTTASTTKH